MTRTRYTVCVVLAAFVGAACPAWADCTEIWIDQATGSNHSGCGESDDPCKSITYALATAGACGWPEPWCVYIRPGVYDASPSKPIIEREIFPLPLGPQMVFEGTDRDTCIIDGQHLTQGLAPLLKGENLIGLQIRNLTFRNMNHSQGNGGAIELIQCSGELVNCVIENCGAATGGGMSLHPRSATGEGFDFVSCTFSGNTATAGNRGGGLAINGTLTGNMTDCSFTDNSATGSAGGGFGVMGSFTGNITGCTFTGNTTGGDSGGGFEIRGTLTGDIQGCSFSNNSMTNSWYQAWRYGGGLVVHGSMNGDISDCSFTDNSSYAAWHAYGGGIAINNTLNGNISNCTFEGNATWTPRSSFGAYGGGVYIVTHNGHIDGCTFANNTVAAVDDYRAVGAGFYVGTLSNGITNCTFTGNAAEGDGDGFYANGNLTGGISDSTFVNNGPGWAAAFRCVGSFTGDLRRCSFVNDHPSTEALVVDGLFNGTMEQCRFVGFPIGAVSLPNNNSTMAVIRDCLFVAPKDTTATGWWGVYTKQKASIHNNTMIGPGLDTALSPAAVLFEFNTQADNSKVFNNVVVQTKCAIRVKPTLDMPIHHNTFWDVDCIVVQGESCLGNDCDFLEMILDNFRDNECDQDTGFVSWPTGTWTDPASYDSAAGQTTFFDDSASWCTNELAGLILNPRIAHDLRALIVANTATTITVWGDYAAHGSTGTTYQIIDYHLSDASPCIDAGDPNADYTGQTDLDGNPRVADGDADGVPVVDRGAHEFHAPLVQSVPADQQSLWRSAHNTIRLTFGGDISAPEAGEILIQKLLDGGDFGSDLSSFFTFAVEDVDIGGGVMHPRVLKIVETTPCLTHRTWIALRNAEPPKRRNAETEKSKSQKVETSKSGGWAGVAPFEVQYVVMIGDCNKDKKTLASDLSCIFPCIPTANAPDQLRCDINGDGKVLATDLSACFLRIPSATPPKPSGH